MCGVAGIFRFDHRPVTAATIDTMTRTLDHRGPDARGRWCGPGVALGHTRLSIIDPAGSDQPMTSPDGEVRLVFNGEILNYRTLRAELPGPFRTAGDTEVLLRILEADGPDGLPRLRGQFAVALYDGRADQLLLARDPAGILPLYYAVDGERLVFASEIKALLTVLGRRPAVDRQSLHEYLGQRSVHAPHTLFEGISKLPPGHWLRADRSGRTEIRPFWRLPEAGDLLPLRGDQAVDRVQDTLRAAVAESMVADVPVGAYLSGGLDSSLIVALAREARPGTAPLHTYSAGFAGSPADERPWARQVSDHLGTVHREVLVLPEDLVATWAPLTWHRDAPLSEPADIARYRLAQAAAEEVKVVLSGEGSDELFGGYPKHRSARAAAAAALLPSALRRPLLYAAERRLPPGLGRLRIALRAVAEDTSADRLRTWFAPFSSRERVALLGVPSRGPSPWYDEARGDPIRRMLHADFRGWLPDNLLESGDRMTMAASVEMRPPFLDRRLVDLAFRLPSSVKVRGGTTKWVVREVAGRYLPRAVIDRRKVGFSVPLDRWFRSELRDFVHDTLTSRSSFVGELLSPAPVRALLDDHDSGRRDEHIRLWTLLGLEVWYDVSFRKAGYAAPQATPAYQTG